ncbi:hypothetical protein BKA70DRAFT_1368913 [Coprinopsis sp. MPI-PUGE-AT-0042]|nr:hypothetical protein BKA70DRAFT_1368913 [Coprinopsis sp. MPI-PUGE-AT-0042]
MDFNPWASSNASSSGSVPPNPIETTTQTSDAPFSATDSQAVIAKPPKDNLLVIFIHGFKGTDDTFEQFPQRIHHLLTESLTNVNVECIIFPAYETKGDLDKAIIRFADWLTTLTVEREVACGQGAGSTKIVLCGHSMGGLLAADTLREFVNTKPDKNAPLWPNIVALLAFDTPYLGLHPHIVRNSLETAAGHVSTAQTIGSALFGSLAGFSAGKASTATPPNAASSSSQSAWSKWVGPAAYAIGGAVVAGAAAGGAYYARDQLTQGYTWATDHMKYVGNLWDNDGMKARVESLMDIDEQEGVVFRNFYTYLPPSIPRYLTSRTFCVLPAFGSRSASRFIAANNSIAPDEIQAHTGMFNPANNDGYYGLGLMTSQAIHESLHKWEIFPSSVPSSPSGSSSPGESPSSTPQPATDDAKLHKD